MKTRVLSAAFALVVLAATPGCKLLEKKKKNRPAAPVAPAPTAPVATPAGLQMPPFHPELAGYDRDNAVFLALLADLVYEQGRVISETVIGKWGCQAAFYNDRKTGTQALFVGKKGWVVLAFRGTEVGSMKDIVTDVRFTEIQDSKGGGHTGFRRQVTKLERNGFFNQFAEFRRQVKGSGPEPKLFVTGHSLGAALATLAAERIADFHQLMTFASPLAYNETSAVAFNAKFRAKTIRFVNYKDGVTRYGDRKLLMHVGQYFHFDGKGVLFKGTRQHYVDYSVRESVNGQLLKDHSMKAYLQNLQRSDNSRDAVMARSVNHGWCRTCGPKFKKRERCENCRRP